MWGAKARSEFDKICKEGDAKVRKKSGVVMRATVTSKGQVTIPKKIRELAHIGSGTQLDFQVVSDGVLTVRPITGDIKKLQGIAKKRAGVRFP